MRGIRRQLVVATLAAATLLAACGSSGITDEAATQLEARVQAVRQAATSGQAGEARAELADLRALAQGLAASGDVDETALERILVAAAEVESGLALLDTTTAPPPPETSTTSLPTTTTTTSVPTTSTTAQAGKREEDEEEEDQEEAGEGDEERGNGNGSPPGRGNRPGNAGGGEDRD